MLGLFFYDISAIVWIVELAKIPLSIAYPMVGLSYVMVVILSAFFLNEQLNNMKIFGLILIVPGVYTISRS
ncbi:SMR family transporter [Paenibacillus sp. FSL R7-0198]|uniref:SMR family transporter n=1 Tax=Paenibacillus sp. FSL R7-0198 TaxID=2921674 RepID=UPI004046D291